MILCTTASQRILPELELLRKSIDLFIGPAQPLYVLWTGPVPRPSHEMPNATYLFDAAPFDLKTVGVLKARALAWALERDDKALYVDCDVCFVGDWRPDIAAGVTFSRHLTNNEHMYGKYNSGFIGVTDKSFPGWWERQPKECPGSYGDQQCLDKWHQPWIFPEQHNVGWWRYWDAPEYADAARRIPSSGCFRMEARGGTIFYNGAPLRSVHTHLLTLPGYTPANAPFALTFNRIFLDCLSASTDHRHQTLHRIIGGHHAQV